VPEKMPEIIQERSAGNFRHRYSWKVAKCHLYPNNKEVTIQVKNLDIDWLCIIDSIGVFMKYFRFADLT
jgi:hypothetical protein